MDEWNRLCSVSRNFLGICSANCCPCLMNELMRARRRVLLLLAPAERLGKPALGEATGAACFRVSTKWTYCTLRTATGRARLSLASVTRPQAACNRLRLHPWVRRLREEDGNTPSIYDHEGGLQLLM